MSLLVSGYRIGEKISEGSRTAVYRGFRESDCLPVVIKTLKSEYPSQKDLSRIKHEYEILDKLNISGIVRTYGLEKQNNRLALILGEINGKTLKEFIKDKTLKITEFLPIAIRLSEIVGKIHNKNIIHKDIHPRNIIINPEAGETNIIDFGHASLLKKEEQTGVNPGSLEGTLAYMSPEQTGRMNRLIDYRTDFYSLGVTFYEMLTGMLPFQTNDVMEIVHCHIARIPISPIEINNNIPLVISEIVMKLLAKNAEDRYQSAYGLKRDLDECLNQLKEKEDIKNFTIAQRDLSEHFTISQKLYGRASEISTLLKSFEKASMGNSEILLVSGYSGAGKSSLVHEVHKPIERQRGYFISGKFDQYKRTIPYSALIQAFQELVRQLLTESEESLKKWKHDLIAALSPNAQVIIDVIPDVVHIVGRQSTVPQLEPQETQNRFNMVFQQFLGVFAEKEHPLVLFLDDLQWADSATLDLLKVLITGPDSKFLFVIGAYRDNEVDESHHLMTTLHAIQKTGLVVNNIKLSPLDTNHINQLISDTLYCNKEKVEPLSELVMNKTGGNPFFVNQFLQLLYEEGLIFYDTQIGNWQWSMAEIKQRGVTDNVSELMAGKIMCLQDDTQNILKLAACIGNQFDLNTLSVVNNKSTEETVLTLWQGVKEGLIAPIDDSYIYPGAKGQELGVRDKKGDHNEIISETGCMDESNRSDSGNLSENKDVSQRRNICSGISNSEGGHFSTGEHSGGMGARDNEGAYSISKNSKGITHGIGNAPDHISKTEIRKGKKYKNTLSHDSTDWEDSQRINKKSIQKIKSSLPTPDPWPPTPNPKFRFLHDRIQQAAYSLIPDNKKKELHLKVGRLLLEHTTQENNGERIIDLVSHLNRGIELITDDGEIIEIVKLNLKAGKKAMASAAYNAALGFMITGMEILPENRWTSQYKLTLYLYTKCAEAAYLCGDYSRMDDLIHEVIKKAVTTLDKVMVYKIKVLSFIAQNKPMEAVNTALDILKQLGVSVPEKPAKILILRERYRTRLALLGKTINDLNTLPKMTDPEKRAIIEIIQNAFLAFYFTSRELLLLLIYKMVAISVKYGNSPLSPLVYAHYGFVLCAIEGKLDNGYRFGTLSMSLVEEFHVRQIMPKVYMMFNISIRHWKKHLEETLEPALKGYQIGIETGDLGYACYCALLYVVHLMGTGMELKKTEQEMVKYQNVSRNLKQDRVVYVIQAYRQSVLNLMEYGGDTCRLKGSVFDEEKMLPAFEEAGDHTTIGALYFLKSMLCYIYGNYHESLENVRKAEKYSTHVEGDLNVSRQNLYHSLAMLALYPELSSYEKKKYLRKVVSNQKRMKKWAHHAPMNQLHRYYLIEAELARVRGKDTRAIDLFDKAINLAKENKYVNEEALANEVTARFYLLKGKDKTARTYMTDALYCYYRWGAHAKVKDLKEKYPQLLKKESDDRLSTRQMSISTTASTETSSKDLDLSAVMKASQAISGEIFLDNLLEKMMKIVIENASAQRSILIMVKKGELVIEAEGEITRNEVKLFKSVPIEKNGMLPISIIKYTERTQDDVILSDTSHDGIFTEDHYVKRVQLKSVLCIPVMNKGNLMGILYLENNLTKGAFTSERVELLKILSSQIAISLENALFYSTLEQKVSERTRELERSMEELVEKEKMAALGRLVAGIAHEVNTPVGIGVTATSTIESKMKEFMRLYRSRGIKDAEFEDFVKVINEGVQIISRNLQRAAEQIKSFKQVAVDQTNEMKRSFRVKEYMGDVLLSLEPRLKNERVKIDIDCAEDIVIDSYPGAISQILTNLIMNSVVHGFEKRNEGSINIKCELNGKDLLICYKDDGDGINKEVLSKIYDPFFTTNRQDGGSGLGLYIIYNLVTRKLNGTIHCRSKPGEGVLFSIKIPQTVSNQLTVDRKVQDTGFMR